MRQRYVFIGQKCLEAIVHLHTTQFPLKWHALFWRVLLGPRHFLDNPTDHYLPRCPERLERRLYLPSSDYSNRWVLLIYHPH
jgi:hypothetical protein